MWSSSGRDANNKARVCELIYGQPCPSSISTPTWVDLSQKGFELRQSLDRWRILHLNLPTSSQVDIGPRNSLVDIKAVNDYGSTVIGHMFFAATSIYLSGIFDYEISFWNSLGLEVASLGEADIQVHCRTILELAHVAVHKTTLSSLISLLPLRVAGSRTRDDSGREEIMKLLHCIQHGFSVASAIEAELEELWTELPAHGTGTGQGGLKEDGSWLR